MSDCNAKRLRTMASVLWNVSDDEGDAVGQPLKCTSDAKRIADLESEATFLRAKVTALEEQKAALTEDTLQLFEVQKFVVPLGGQPGVRTVKSTPHSWLEDNPHLLELPRMNGFPQQWENSALKRDVVFDLCAQNDLTASRF